VISELRSCSLELSTVGEANNVHTSGWTEGSDVAASAKHRPERRSGVYSSVIFNVVNCLVEFLQFVLDNDVSSNFLKAFVRRQTTNLFAIFVERRHP